VRNSLRVIHEDTDSLKQRLQHEHHGRKTPRLQMLYWLASRQAPTSRDVALLLGVRRNTVGHWLALYASGGLGALLDLSVPAGKPLAPRQRCWPRWRRRPGNPCALPPMRPGASGCSRPMTWTSTITPSPRNHRQHDVRRTRHVMENRLRRGLQLGIAEEGMPGVRVAVEAREVSAGDIDTEAMPRLEHHAGGPEIERILIDHAWDDGAGIGPRFAVACAASPRSCHTAPA